MLVLAGGKVILLLRIGRSLEKKAEIWLALLNDNNHHKEAIVVIPSGRGWRMLLEISPGLLSLAMTRYNLCWHLASTLHG